MQTYGACKQEKIYMYTENIMFLIYSMCFDYQCSCKSIYLDLAAITSSISDIFTLSVCFCFLSIRLRPISSLKIQAKPPSDQSTVKDIQEGLYSGFYLLHHNCWMAKQWFNFWCSVFKSLCVHSSGVLYLSLSVFIFLVFCLYMSLCS